VTWFNGSERDDDEALHQLLPWNVSLQVK